MWRIDHGKKAFVSDADDLRLHCEKALFTLITVIKSLSKCYRLVDLMKMADIITKNMFYNYLTQNSTDRLNHFSTDLTTKKSCGMDEKEFKTKKYCGMDESAFLTKKSMGKPENLQYTKEINSSEAKNPEKTDN